MKILPRNENPTGRNENTMLPRNETLPRNENTILPRNENTT